MKATIIIILIFTASICIGQNDTIYLFENYIELNGLKYNLVENNIKTGSWIDFAIEDNAFIHSMGSGDSAHFYYNIYTEYRPLKNGEYNGIEILTSENEVDTVKGELIFSGNYLKIVNRIPSDKYHISGKGIYKNDRKEEKWIYLHKNQKLKKEIIYKNGIPKKGFIIYRPNETKMIELKKINDEEWEVIKFSETGKEVKRERNTIDEIKELF